MITDRVRAFVRFMDLDVDFVAIVSCLSFVTAESIHAESETTWLSGALSEVKSNEKWYEYFDAVVVQLMKFSGFGKPKIRQVLRLGIEANVFTISQYAGLKEELSSVVTTALDLGCSYTTALEKLNKKG